jgi:PAS domain S-box-containing protein
MHQEPESIKILHIDDEPDFLASTKIFLERRNKNFSVDTATSAEEGLALLKEDGYDVVVADYKLLGMDGLELFQHLRENGNTIPFIMFTGKGREEVAMEALNRGANYYLQKDGNIEYLYGNLAEAIKEKVEQKRTADKIAELEEERQIVLDSVPAMIFHVDCKSNYVYVNKLFAETFGLTPDEFKGKQIEAMFPEHGEVYIKSDEEVLKSGLAKIGITSAIHTPTGTRWIRTDKVPVKDAKGNVTGIIGFGTDITERKQAEEERERLLNELEAKNRELEHFTYTVSHDLRSPLVTIQGFTNMLQKDLERNAPEKAHNDLKYVANAATKMDRLLRDTLELSRIGRMTNPPEKVPFGAIVDDALEQTVEHIRSSGAEISVAKNLPAVFVDRMRIVEMLVNLITNCIKYRDEQRSPRIDIGYRVEEEDTVFFVKDNGRGIDPSQHEKVFELFYQVDSSGDGTGAGLAIVKRIIEIHGGRIWIESEKGQGCKVCFTLPEQSVKCACKMATRFRFRFADNTKTVENGSLCDALIKVAKLREKTLRNHTQLLRSLSLD